MTEKRQWGRHREIQGRRVAKGRVWLLKLSWCRSSAALGTAHRQTTIILGEPQGDAQLQQQRRRWRWQRASCSNKHVMGPVFWIPTGRWEDELYSPLGFVGRAPLQP